MVLGPLAPLVLAPDEVATLTGFKTRFRQVNWLREKGWRFELSGNRQPIIARRYAEKMLGCDGDADHHPKPNFAAILRAI